MVPRFFPVQVDSDSAKLCFTDPASHSTIIDPSSGFNSFSSCHPERLQPHTSSSFSVWWTSQDIRDPYKIQIDVFSGKKVLLTRAQFIFNTLLKVAFISGAIPAGDERGEMIAGYGVGRFQESIFAYTSSPFSCLFSSRYLPSFLSVFLHLRPFQTSTYQQTRVIIFLKSM